MKRLGLLLALVVLAVTPGRAQIGTVMPVPMIQFVDINGNPLSGGLLYTCVAVSSCPGTPLATYSNSTLTTPNANPVVLDSSGRATVYLSPATYKFVLQTSAAVIVWTQDNVAAMAPWNLNTVAGRVVYTAPTVLTIAAGSVTPINNVHAIDTSGGAANLNTLTISGSVTAAFTLYLTPNNGGANPVTVKNGAGNITMAGGDYIMDGPTRWILLILKGSTWYEVARALPAVSVIIPDPSVDTFRLSLTTATCATTADVTAAVTVYFTPCTGNVVALYDGAAVWTVMSTAELSIAVPATTGQVYDVFVYNNAGTPTLETLVWTNDTTRATALVRQDGVWVKTGATTRRYVGSFRTGTVAGQTEDSLTKRYLFNASNRKVRALQRLEATASWTYNVNTIRQANGAAANQVEVLVGLSEEPVTVDINVTFTQATSTNTAVVGVGLDSTTTFAGNQNQMTFYAQAGIGGIGRSKYNGFPGVGKHVLSWNEVAFTNVTTTFWGASTNVGALGVLAASSQSGMIGQMIG